MKTLRFLSTHYLGLILFVVALIICAATYKDYGIAWDEPAQRELGNVAYDYVCHLPSTYTTFSNRQYGVGFELPLIAIERYLKLTDSRDIYLMRHCATHLLFLLSAFSGYILFFRLFKNKYLASLGFLMIAFAPGIYAHSFFNSKDLPFLSLFLITLTITQVVFERNKTLGYLILGALCGYTTSIRIMGVMLGVFLLILLS